MISLQRFGSFDDAVAAVRDGDIPAAVRQDGDVVELRYSATDQVSAGTVQGIVQSVVGRANLELAGTPPRFTVDSAQVEDESFEPIQYLTSGLLAWAVAMSAAFGAAMNLVTWRRNEVLRRLRMSPVSPAAVVGARIGVSLVVAVAQAAVFIAVAVTPAFGLQLRGSWWLALPLLIAGTLAFLAEEAASAAVNLIVLPMAFLSGVFFPIDDMPGWVQGVASFMPMRHLSTGLLDVLVRDATVGAILVPLAVLLGFAAVVTLVATRVFTWDT